VVVEGAKDALRLREYGIGTSVASLGTGLTEEQLELIAERFDEVTIFSDNDAAGHLAQFKMAQSLAERVARVFVVTWQVARKDPNELSEKTVRSMLARRIHWTVLVEPDYNPWR
jgi:DNA primase